MVPQQHHSVETIDEQEQGVVEKSTMLFASFTRSAFLRAVGTILIVGVPIVILVLLVLYPLAAIILQSIFPDLYALNPNITPSLAALNQVLSNPLQYQALGNSLWLSAITAIIASLLGTILAILARRTNLPFELRLKASARGQ